MTDLADSPGAALLVPIPVSMMEDSLSEKKKRVLKTLGKDPSAPVAWVAEQNQVSSEYVRDLLDEPKAREYLRSWMAEQMSDSLLPRGDLIDYALAKMAILADINPAHYLVQNEAGKWEFSVERLQNAPSGAVEQIEIVGGKVNPTFVDKQRARQSLFEYKSSMTAARNSGVAVNVNVLADPEYRQKLRDNLMKTLQPPKEEQCSDVLDG